LKTAKLIAYVKIEGQTVGELRLAESGDIWPDYAENMRLKKLGYWYGNHANHKYLCKDYNEAKEIINNHYGAIVEEI
jgi:hypothetical protein